MSLVTMPTMCHCYIVSLVHQELCSHFFFVFNTCITSDVQHAELMALFSIYCCQVYFHSMFQHFSHFSNLFLNVFLLYFIFCHIMCVALQ